MKNATLDASHRPGLKRVATKGTDGLSPAALPIMPVAVSAASAVRMEVPSGALPLAVR